MDLLDRWTRVRSVRAWMLGVGDEGSGIGHCGWIAGRGDVADGGKDGVEDAGARPPGCS
ncbi:hypothetical protein ACLOJK_022843, partial [Asimina triloba]